MFGILFGAACLVGLFVMIKRGMWHAGGWHHGHGWRDGWREGWRGGWQGGWGGEPGGPGFGPRAALRVLFQRLDTTPGQEKVIVEAFDEVRASAEKARQEVRASRTDVAKAMRAESFDAVMMGDLFGRHDRVLEDVRKAAVGAMSKVHDVLDERQRAVFGDVIEHGGLFAGFGFGRRPDMGPGPGFGPGPQWGGGCGPRWGRHAHHHAHHGAHHHDCC
jgi:hypothetical protein